MLSTDRKMNTHAPEANVYQEPYKQPRDSRFGLGVVLEGAPAPLQTPTAPHPNPTSSPFTRMFENP